MNGDLSLRKLQELVHALAWNDGFGCHTRAGFEKMVWPEIAHKAKFIVYFDVDGVHALNELHGSYEPVDAMIKKALSVLRSTDIVAAQLKSGDEFLICLTETDDRKSLDPEGLRSRLIASFATQGMSITSVIVPVKSTDLLENIQPAVDQVYAAKKQRGTSR